MSNKLYVTYKPVQISKPELNDFQNLCEARAPGNINLFFAIILVIVSVSQAEVDRLWTRHLPGVVCRGTLANIGFVLKWNFKPEIFWWGQTFCTECIFYSICLERSPICCVGSAVTSLHLKVDSCMFSIRHNVFNPTE